MTGAVIEWYDAELELPSEPGNYLVTSKWGEVEVISYLEGWNNFRKEDGTLVTKWQMEDGWVIAWAPLPQAFNEPVVILEEEEE